MWPRRIGYFFAVACCFIFFIFYKEWFSWLLLWGVLWLPVLSLVLSLPAIFTVRLRICAPQEVRTGMPARAPLFVEGPFPRVPVNCQLRLVNELNGERYVGKPGELIPTEHCGHMVMRCSKLWVYDYMGLSIFRKNADVQGSDLILPRPTPHTELPAPEHMPVRSWMIKPGGGLAENYDLRPYRPGDELRQIHWKLSAKVGSWIYKEALEPVQKQVVLTLTLSGTPEQLDRKLGRVYGISAQLLDQGMPCRVCCHTGQGLLELDVSDRKTQQQAMRTLLGTAPTLGEADFSTQDALWLCRIGGDADEA